MKALSKRQSQLHQSLHDGAVDREEPRDRRKKASL